MATKSILKNVDIKDRKLARSFIYALEKAQSKKSKEVHLSRTCSEATGDEIKKLFGVSK